MLKNCLISFDEFLGRLEAEDKFQKLQLRINKLLETDTEIKQNSMHSKGN